MSKVLTEEIKDRIHILLPVHNRKDITLGFIDCLLKQQYQNYHLVLIDDGSTDGTSEAVQALIDQHKLTVIRGDGNLWWAGSLQKGYEWLVKNKIPGDEMLLIINDDLSFGEEFLLEGAKALKGTNRTLVQAVDLMFGIREKFRGFIVNWKDFSHTNTEDVSKVNCLSTRGLFLRVKDIVEVGGFYPKLLRHYCSDYEFTVRAHKKGFTLKASEKLIISANHETTGFQNLTEEDYKKSFSKFLQIFFSTRSALNIKATSMYIILACPWKYKIPNLFRIWKTFIKEVYIFFGLRARKLLLGR